MAKAKKTKKDLMAAPGDFVVYPTHGVGKVTNIETQEIAGQKLRLFVISFEGDRMTLKVPTAKAEVAGLRRLSSRKIMDSALTKLASISLSLRHPRHTAFRSETFSNKALLLAYGWVILILILATELSFFQRILDTEPLTTQQWGICFVAALVFFFVGEFIKWGFRLFSKPSE